MTKETIPFSFSDIYSNIQAKFTENGYDYQEGSNTAQLITAMSYLVSMLNANTAVNINENILTLARKRTNILQDARLLGYEPGNKISYQYELELTLPAGNFILPKYSKFISGDKTYYYYGEIITLIGVEAGYKLNIIVKEGTLIKSTESSSLTITLGEITENGVTKPQYYVDIPYTNIEDDGIESFLTYYNTDGVLFNKEQWTKLETFTVDSDTILNKQFYRLNSIGYDTPRLYFKLPNTAGNLTIGTKIELNILQSSGSSGNITFDVTTDLNCEITNYTLKVQGTEEETNESIKQNAPLFWNAANRAVTKNDYKSICERLTAIDKVFVWDGNDEYPKIPGKIWFSFIPSTRTRQYLQDEFKTTFQLDLSEDEENWFLEDTEITNTFNYLDVYKIPTLNFIHRHPIYLDFEFDIEILKYDITASESEQNQLIFNVINEFFYNNTSYKIEMFESNFFRSNLIKRIDTQITDITGINSVMRNSITLYSKYIVNESGTNKIIVPLGFPYEDYYDTAGNLLPEKMPSIDTIEFLPTKNLTVDWSTLTGEENLEFLVELNIKLNTTVVGKYKIFYNKYILVELNIDGVNLTTANIEQKILNVKYNTENVQISKNTIPRLKRVNFI